MADGTPYTQLRWEVQQRLKFIEARLFWHGRVNRRSIVEHYGISGVQATNDISRYMELAPKNLVYDRSKKTYLATEEFEAILTHPEPETLLCAGSENSENPILPIPWESLPPIHRNVDHKILRKVVRAAQEQMSIEVRYQSMSKPEPSWRWISPHSFSHDGMRWHVRAYCFIDNSFKDFLLSRFLEIGKERPGIISREEDRDWNSKVRLEIIPHPGLSAGQKNVIEADYGMENGLLALDVRRALLPYFLQRYGLIREKEKPEEQQISLANRDELSGLRSS